MKTILHIDASARGGDSVSRTKSAQLVKELADENGASVIYRNLADGIPLVTETMVNAYFTPEEDRTEEQKEALKASDELVAELQQSDALVIGTPVYNFSVPGALKAWADLVARMGVTVKYEDGRPVGQLADRPTKVAVAYGGTEIGSKRDFATPWLTVFLNYIGLKDIEYIDATAE